MSQSGNGDAPRTGEISPKEREAFRQRSRNLGQKLDVVKDRRAPPPDNRARGAAMAQGMRIAVELVVGVGFGGFVGWGLDRYFETSGPWFLIVFVLLGFAAGMLNVIRMAKRMQAEVEAQQMSAPSVKDDERDD